MNEKLAIALFIETDGEDKGRVSDVNIAWEMAEIEDAWREEGDGRPVLSPPERLGKSEIHFRDLVNLELKRVIAAKLVQEMEQEFDLIYSDPELRQADPEESDERWMSYGIANTLLGIGKEHGFDEETCYEIYAMPFVEAFETAYNYLTQAELNADEVLAPWFESHAELS